jgi:hypothetical protein
LPLRGCLRQILSPSRVPRSSTIEPRWAACCCCCCEEEQEV